MHSEPRLRGEGSHSLPPAAGALGAPVFEPAFGCRCPFAKRLQAFQVRPFLQGVDAARGRRPCRLTWQGPCKLVSRREKSWFRSKLATWPSVTAPPVTS